MSKNIDFFRGLIDAGHGGKDPGAVNRVVGITESDVALAIAKEVRKCFKSKKRKFKFTRTSDVYVDLNDRWEMANAWDADLVLCIHLNSTIDSKVRGCEVYHLGNNDKDLAKKISARISKSLKIPNRGAKEHAFAMTKYPNCRAVLIEVDFISNNTFAKKCKKKAYIKKIAKAIYKGVRDYEKQH